MQTILIYNQDIVFRPNAFSRELTMTGTLTTLFISLALLLGALWWVFRP